MIASSTNLDTANLETIVSDTMKTTFVKMEGVLFLVAFLDIQGSANSFWNLADASLAPTVGSAILIYRI